MRRGITARKEGRFFDPILWNRYKEDWIVKDDHFRRSCEMQQQGYQQVIHCQDDAGKPYTVDDMTGWTRIAAGQGRCNPCKQTINARGGDIRGDSAKDAPK